MEEIIIDIKELEEVTVEDEREVVIEEVPVYPELENLTVKPTAEEQVFNHDNSYGYDEVRVEAIQDENLVPENIKNDVEILGVKGSFVGEKFKPRYTYKPITFESYNGTELDHEVFMLDTTYFTTFYRMFYYCPNLTHLDLSSWNTSNVTSMLDTFYMCSKLTSLNVNGWNTSNVTNMSGMFGWCRNITTLDLSSFDTSNVTSMSNMFTVCSVLKYLDIRNFTFDKVTSYMNMFNSIPNDCLIIVKGQTEKEWVLARESDLTNVKTVAELGE